MITGKTKSGFEYSIEDFALDNFELVEEFAKADAGDAAALIRAIEMLIGKEQKKKLYDHLRTEHGNVPIEKFKDELSEILGDAKLKNL